VTESGRKWWARALFGCVGADVPAEVVLLVRLLAIAWLLTGHALLLPTRSVPFFEVLAPIANSPVVAWAEFVVGVVSAVQLLLGRAVRVSALTLGCLIFVTTLLSRAYFSNNRLYTACLLVLAGLEASQGPKLLLRAQVIVLYLAAGLDKLFDADWRSGAFLRSFASHLASYGRLWSPGHDATTAYLPARLFGSLLDANPGLVVFASWGTLLLEIGIGLLLLAGRRRIGIALGLAFHAGLLVYTGSPMGMFFYAATASYFAFVDLPSRIDVRAGPSMYAPLLRVLAAVDADGRCHVQPGPRLSVSIAGQARYGANAMLALAVRLPAFYVAAAVILAGPWFTPWSALVLIPLALGFCPFGPLAPRTEIREVTG
jgi:hypothetical protein